MSTQKVVAFPSGSSAEMYFPKYSYADKPLPLRPRKEGGYVHPKDKDIDFDRRNKPLPKEPSDHTSSETPDPDELLEGEASTDEIDPISPLRPRRPQGTSCSLSGRHPFDETKRCVWPSRNVNSCRGTGKPSPLRGKNKKSPHGKRERKPYLPMSAWKQKKTRSGKYRPKVFRKTFGRGLQFNRPSSQLQRTGEELERGLLNTFFGFDGQFDTLNHRQLDRVPYLLTNQSHPDDVVGQEIYPIVCCVWLRNFIVTFIHRLNHFDRGRLRGLKLEDCSFYNVHRGFGLLWDFLEACGSTAHDQPRADVKEGDRSNELHWFKDRSIHPADAEHMLQIWNALKSLLTMHSIERQRLDTIDQLEDNVVIIMKRGLGTIQRYLASTKLDITFGEESNAGGFFETACLEWQDSFVELEFSTPFATDFEGEGI